MFWKDDHDFKSCSQKKRPHSFISVYLACLPESDFLAIKSHLFRSLFCVTKTLSASSWLLLESATLIFFLTLVCV